VLPGCRTGAPACAGAGRRLLRLNLLLLLAVVFLPFPTGLVAEALHNASSEDERVYVTLYGLTLLAIRLLGSALNAYARHEHLYSPHEDGEEPQDTPPKKLLPVVIGYVIAILIGLAAPGAAVALYFGLATPPEVPNSLMSTSLAFATTSPVLVSPRLRGPACGRLPQPVRQALGRPCGRPGSTACAGWTPAPSSSEVFITFSHPGCGPTCSVGS
jgi:hypothetical protein